MHAGLDQPRTSLSEYSPIFVAERQSDQPLNAGFLVAVIQLDLERELESALRVDKAFFAKDHVG